MRLRNRDGFSVFGFERIGSQTNYDLKGKVRILYCCEVFVIYQPLLKLLPKACSDGAKRKQVS